MILRFQLIPVQKNRWETLRAAILTVLVFCATLPTSAARAQETPLSSVDEECTAIAYASDGRIALGVRHVYNLRQFQVQRDDIFVVGTDGKRKKIVNGEKLVRGAAAFSYTVSSLRWSPDGSKLIAELLTTQMIDSAGNTKDGVVSLLLEDSGKEIKIHGGDSDIADATNAAWLGDGVTVVYLTEAVKPKLLYSINSVRPVSGVFNGLFVGHTFSAVAWNPKQSAAVAVERASSLSGSPNLVSLDLTKQTSHELATLESFAGGLSVSPSGAKAAYYLDHEVLEIRDVAAPERSARLRVGFGVYQWTPDERRIVLKRGLEHKTADLEWFDVPALTAPAGKTASPAPPAREPSLTPILHGLTYRDFEISPDGRFLAVVQPGKRNLLIFPWQ
jgi:Tol biopolymer transport system component